MRRSGRHGPPGATPHARARTRAALLVLALACAFVVQSPGWAQTSYMSLSRALASGTAKVDRWHWQTHDIAYTDGHYYSVKPPGLPLATLPLFAVLREAGGERWARAARLRGESGGGAQWSGRNLPIAQYGYSLPRARAAREAIADDAPLTWALGLLGVVAPAIALLALVARRAERISAGTGAAVALTLGAGSLMLPFSTLYFSHVLSALLGFGAFALVWRERERTGAPRARALAFAGLLAGLAVVCEYPLAIVAAIVGVYALAARARPRELARRGLAYGAGAAAGVAPLLAYQWWAFGSPLHTTYRNAVAFGGRSGHDVLGLNDDGLFGVTAPDPATALELLFGGRGLLTLAPVLAMALAGAAVLALGRRHRAEGIAIAAVAVAYLVYNSGYWLPFGGGSPGPRFLLPALPFVALGLAVAWRRWPAPTLALAAISATTMAAATVSYPMIGVDDVGVWSERIVEGRLQHSVLDLLGVLHGPPAIAPFALLVAAALALGVGSLGRAELARGARLAPAAVAVWALAATFLQRPLELPSTGAVALIAVAALVGLATVALARPPRGRRRSAQHEQHHVAAQPPLDAQAVQRAG